MAVTRTIGAGGDHADINSWVAWVQANQLDGSGNLLDHQIGQVLASGVSTAGVSQTISGWSPGPNGYTTTLTAAPGASVFDNPDNPLYYNAANGAFIDLSNGTSTGGTLTISVQRCTISRLQIRSSGTYKQPLTFGSWPSTPQTNGVLDSCILFSDNDANPIGVPALVKNCLFLVNGQNRGGTAVAGSRFTIAFEYCVFAHTANNVKSTLAVSAGSDSYGVWTFKDCVFATNAEIGAGPHGTTRSGSNNATVNATADASLTAWQFSISLANEFVGGTSRNDFRLAATSTQLKDNGIAIAGITTDAYGNTRDATPDIGAFELVAAASSASTGDLTANLDAATLAAIGSLAITGQLDALLDDATVSAIASLALNAQLTGALDDVTLAATGASSNTGLLTVSLADATLVAAGSLALRGALTANLGNVILSAVGRGPNAPSVTGHLLPIWRLRRR